MAVCLPERLVEGEKGVWWSQIEFFALSTPSGVQPTGTIAVRAKTAISAESIFPCVGLYEPKGAQCARFNPASLSPYTSAVVVNGSPHSSPLVIPLAPVSNGVVGSKSTVEVGCNGWAFFPYCREPPPSVTLSTAGICANAPCDWKDLDAYAEFVARFGVDFEEYVKGACAGSGSSAIPLSVITIKRDLEPGDEFLIVFNQFDGIGRGWAYTTPSPFVRLSAAVPLLSLPLSVQVIRTVLGAQTSFAITDSYVKLLEDTAGTDARTTERIHVALLNLTKAVKHYLDTEGDVVTLPLVVPVSAAVANPVPDAFAAPFPLKRQRGSKRVSQAVPLFADSFRVAQSFVP
jgi:hypothetical protein